MGNNLRRYKWEQISVRNSRIILPLSGCFLFLSGAAPRKNRSLKCVSENAGFTPGVLEEHRWIFDLSEFPPPFSATKGTFLFLLSLNVPKGHSRLHKVKTNPCFSLSHTCFRHGGETRGDGDLVNLSTTISMKMSRRELSINMVIMVIHRIIFENNQI